MKSNKMKKTMDRLNEALGVRFGVEVFFFPIHARGPKPPALETARRNGGAPLIIAHDSMIVPMRVEGTLLGAVEVCGISHLLPVELKEIKNTVDNVLGATLEEIHEDQVQDLDEASQVINLDEFRERARTKVLRPQWQMH